MSEASDRFPARPRVRRGNVDDAQQLRQDLLDAALDLFGEGGLEAVSVRAVAARVGVSPMAMYRYFADKRELLAGLSEFSMRAALQQVRETLAQVGDEPGLRYRTLIGAYIGYWAEHPEQYCLAYGFSSLREISEPVPKLAGHPDYQRDLNLVRSLVEDLARSLGAPMDRVKLAQDIGTAMMLGYMHGVFALKRYPWSKTEVFREAYLDQLLATVSRSLRGQA